MGTQALVNHILGVRSIVDGKLTQCVGDVFSLIEKRILCEEGDVDVDTLRDRIRSYGGIVNREDVTVGKKVL